MWRKCGTKEDIMPCAVFDVNQRKTPENVSAYIGTITSKSKFTRLKQETSQIQDQWKPVESSVAPRPGLIQVCSVESKDCNSTHCLVNGINVLKPLVATNGASVQFEKDFLLLILTSFTSHKFLLHN